MKNEKTWKVLEIVFGVIGAALLVTVLILKIMGKTIEPLIYAFVGVVILFLVCDEIARSIRRRREKAELAREKEEHPDKFAPEPTLPTDAFEFDKPEEKQP